MIAGENGEGRFSTTCWSTVALACDTSSPEKRVALERFCQAYWPPLFAYVLRRGCDLHTAQDLTQSFFAHFIQRGYVRAADRNRGKFRTFLLTCFQHFLIHEWEKNGAAKRGGQFSLLSWDQHSAGLKLRAAISGGMPAEKHYDREWALAIMERALDRLRLEFCCDGRDQLFEVLRVFLQMEAATGDYDKVGKVLGLEPRAVKLAVHRMRRRYGRIVRDEVRRTVTNEADVAEELHYLVELISS